MRAGLSLRNDLLNRAGSRLVSGVVRFYDGAQPTDSDTSLSGNVNIVTCALSASPYTVSSGVLTVTLPAATVLANGTPTFARFFQFGGVLAEFDLTVGTDIILSKDDWTAGEPFSGFNVQVNLPVGT